MLKQTTINEISEVIEEVAEQEGDEIIVRASKQRKKLDAINPFSLCFHRSLSEIIHKSNISRASIVLLLHLIDLSAMGNLLSINQKQLAKHFGVSGPAMSKRFSELKKSKLLIDTDFGLFLNPQVISKGALTTLAQNDPLAAHAIAAMQALDLEINYGTEAQLKRAGLS